MITIPKTANNFKAIYEAIKLIDKKDARKYCKYITVQKKAFYITDSKALFKINQHEYDTIEDGFYMVESKTKSQICLVRVCDIENNAPDFEACLNPAYDDYKTLHLTAGFSHTSLAYIIYTKTKVCIDFNYVKVLFDLDIYSELLFKEKSAMFAMTDILTFVVMPINMDHIDGEAIIIDQPKPALCKSLNCRKG